MDKEFIRKQGLTEAVKRFQQIMEYVDAGSPMVNEDDNDPNAMQQDPSMGGGDPSMMGGDPSMMGADPSMGGGDPSMDGGDPSMGGGDPSMMGGDPSMGGGDPSMMGGDPSMGGGAEGFAPQGQTEPMVPEEEGEDEEVIDVDELVDSQKETEDKLDSLTDKFDKLLSKIEDFEKNINDSNERMESLKSEIEKRNPTPVEKLSLRSKNSYPFNVSPEEYWKDKEMTSNYSTEDDNNGADDREYQITKDEIDNFNDYSTISKTFDDFDLNKMFGF